MTKILVANNEQLETLVQNLNELVAGHGKFVRIEAAMVLECEDAGFGDVLRGILQASGVEYHLVGVPVVDTDTDDVKPDYADGHANCRCVVEPKAQAGAKKKPAHSQPRDAAGQRKCEFCDRPTVGRSAICGSKECLEKQKKKWWARPEKQDPPQPEEPKAYTVLVAMGADFEDGRKLSSSELGAELKAGSLAEGTRLRHKARGVFRVAKVDGAMKLVHVREA